MGGAVMGFPLEWIQLGIGGVALLGLLKVTFKAIELKRLHEEGVQREALMRAALADQAETNKRMARALESIGGVVSSLNQSLISLDKTVAVLASAVEARRV